MNSSGYRGRNFGPRGARINGPTNGFNGPRFPHPSFNHPRPPHRLSGPDKWIERANFAPWQQNKNFLPHPQYRGNLQFRPNNRGRTTGRGILRFSGPGRPSTAQFCMGFIRNPVHRPPLLQEQDGDKSILISQTPLLGSEEERQQKILETADKLKQKLSSITEEELTNFWEDDLSVLPNNSSEEENIRNKGIPELSHEPPELDLTFTDFRDIGRVDCINSKFENVDSKSNNEISINFEQKSTDNVISTNDKITIIDENNKGKSLIILDSICDKDNLLKNDKCYKQIHDDLTNFEFNEKNLHFQNNNVPESLITSTSNNINEKSSNLNKNITNLLSIESVNDSLPKKSPNVNNIESILVSTTNNNNELKINFSQNQNIVQIDTQSINENITQDININVQHNNDYVETKLLENNQIQNNLQTNISQEISYKNLETISNCSQNRLSNFSSSSGEIYSNITCDSTSTTCSNYNDSSIFQSRIFNIPLRFTPRIDGSKCHWTFQQNGKNLFFKGSQRLSFHGNQISSPRHVASFKSTDLIPVEFDPRAPPPPFMHNIPISSHEFQQTAIVSFSSNNLPPTFNPNAPPPNIRPKSNIELSREWLQPVPSLDLRDQTINTQNNLKIIQPSTFDLRGPPRISNIPITINEKISEFNPQQPPPKIHRKEKILQPPPIFDPRLSSQERSNLIAPLDISGSNMIPLNLIETSPVSDFKIDPVTQNFSQPPPINISSHQTFISNVQVNFQSVISQTGNEQEIIREFSLPLPPISITELPPPPPPPKEPLIEKNSNLNQNINMDDGLEDMQEAMEFAKQIMNLSEEIKNNDTPSTFSELSLTSKIPIPNETSSYHSLSIEETNTNTTKKQKKKENKNKKCRQNVIYGPELIFEKQKNITTIDEKQNLQNQNKKTEDILLSNDQIRPKVIFNLNSKTKRIHKPEDWHKISINISDNKEISQQKTIQNSNKEKDIYNPRKHYEIRNDQNKNQQKEIKIKKNSIHSASLTTISTHEKSNDTSYHYKNYTKDIEKLKAHSSNMITFNNIITQKNQMTNPKKGSKKQNVATSESLWKNRVISRFLKMSKNDICNMVNNSSLRKFDIVMRHLVKERRSSLSLELRNTEDEKMKEYDREEFMNQLNAMLDPNTVVGITDLPTEFIHHLSEVLQLDPMPFDIESQNIDDDEIEIINQNENLKINTCEYANEENLKIQSFIQQPDFQNVHEEKIEDNFLYNNKESIHYSLNTELNLNTSRENTNLSHRSISNNINSEIENVHKKQPLFNEADLDDILSEVTEKTKNLPNASLSIKSEKFIETCTSALSIQRVTKTFDSNIFSQIPNKTETDLDVIFSAGIARVKQLGNNKINLDNLRARKSNSEDRNTFKSERYERWNRKEDPDTFRNLTKEEWEAKYGIANTAISPTIIRKNVFNSDENLIKDKNNCIQRYCSSDSPMRHLSPLTHEISTYNVDKYISEPNEIEELQNIEESKSGESSLISSSDTDEETVASNVTKLLKVIKEKEKIAKKKSLNETIRDEVAAEIEKKWKEKSKHKEKKSRKRGKRKKDKKDKRRREKRKKKKRSYYSDSSKFSGKIEKSRLLTKDEIKKEVIVKQESTKSEENASFNSEINNTIINKVIDLRIESQCLQIEKEQLSAVTNTTSQSKNKSADIPMQPKTKAQLKQMPESSNTDQMHIMKKTIEITNNKTNNEKIKDLLDMNKDTEITKNNNERIDTVSYTNFSLHQIHVSVNKELPSSIQSQVKSNDTADITSFKSFNYNTLNSVTNLNINNQNVDQKVCTSISSAENKNSGYKKIDIKAYKERALQRRLKEQTISKENPVNSISFIQESHHVLPVNQSNVELLNVMKEIKTNETDINELKDPRLRIRSISTPSLEDSDKEIKQKISLNEMDIVQKNEKSLIPVQLENPSENNIIRPINSDLNIFKDSIKYKKCRNDNKCSSQIITIQEFDEFRKKEKLKFESDKKKSSSTIDFFKFKNIRSEGSKELKLKKEKSKKSTEKKKKDSKPNESRSPINEKSIEKYSYKKISENDQELLILNSHTNDQIEIKKINNDINENLCSTQITETCSKNIKGINDVKTIQEQINTNSIVKEKNQQSTDNRESININKNVTFQVNKEIITENQQIINQNLIETKDDQSLISLISSGEKNNIKEIEKHATEINKLHTISTESENLNLSQYLTIENLDIEKDTYSEMSSIDLTFFSHTPSTEKYMENTILVSNHISKESHPLIEQIDVDIQKNDHSINIKKLLKNIETYNESISDTKMDSKAIVKNDGTNGETNNEEEYQDKLIFQLKTSENHNKVIKNETKSPDSPSSPFKGFFADTICENDICQVSQLCNTKMKSESNKKNVIMDSDQLKTCFNDRLPIIESVKDYRNNARSFSKKMKKDNEITLINNLVKEKQNIQDKTIDNNSLNMRDEVDIIISKTENTDITKNKNDLTYNFPSEQKKILCRFDIENHDTFNEDSEPFIVLDEYIDNANEKSIEKFSTLDLDFEDCIARDANIFTTKSLQVEENSMNNIKSPCFDSIIFNKVSESIFDKKDSVNKGQSQNNITSMHETEKSILSQKNISFSKKLFAPIERTINITDIVSSTSESNIEESKMPNITEPIDSVISDISIECSQNINTTSKDISQKAEEIPESSVIEMRIEKENHNFIISENNSQHNLESLSAAVTSFENKTSEKLNILTEDTNTLSENFSLASISEIIPEKNTEFLVLETKEELDHNSIDQQILVPFEIKMSNNKNASIDSAIEYKASKNSNKTISKKLNQKKRNIMLNNIKNKSRMRLNRCKHKKQKHNISKKVIKEVIKSDTIKNITYPNTKAAVMARMIEIDVEIHKLMTEKMTLYKMLTSGTLPNDDNLQQNNITYENKEVGIPVIRPQTPSMLMSQLIQNIETNPVTNQCAKTNKENLSIKDIPNNPMQSNKFKILPKHDHYTEKKESCTFTYNSDDEITCHIGDIKSLSSTKEKRKKSRLIKKLENKLNSNISNKNIQNTITEKIKVNDITHLTSQKINIKQGMIQQDSDQISMNEIKSQEDMNKICTQQIELSNKDKIEMLKYQEIDKIIESTESQISIEKNIQTKIQTLNERNYLIKDNERNIEILNKKSINIDNKNNDEKNIEKSSENRTPERSSIYSDDSTWDSLFQNSSVDDQKKPTTGLALLEETYKKEMAKTRRIKAEARKKKKKKLQNLLQSVNVLTPDEEELPLSILYIKKLHQKKKLLDSLEQQMKQQTNHNSQLWKNVVEVINVAKNETENLESFEKQSIEDVISHVLNSEKNTESNENKEKQIVDLKSRDITEFYTESLMNHENKNERNNNSKQNNLQILSNKSQEFFNNKHFQKNLEINVSSKIANDLSEISICDTYMNIKENLAKSSEQQTMKNNNIEINQMNSLEGSNSYLTESNLNNIHNNQNISNTSENLDIEKVEKKTDKTNMEFYFQKKLVNTENNITTQELINNQLIITSEDVEKSYDTLIESNNDKNIIIINEKEKINSKIQNVNEEKLQDDKDNNTIKEFNNMYQDEHFISLKEHKEQHNKCSSEENNNQKSISSFIENIEVSKSDIFDKKLYKRKRRNNKTPLRRSSRYAEESAKRIKLEVDIDLNAKQEEKNSKMSPNTLSISLSPCEEIETIFTNSKKNRSIQKPIINRKRCTPMSPEIKILSHESNLNNESLKAIKKYKKHTMSEMMNCIVRVVDCKHMILNPTISLNLLQKYGISRINTNMYSNSSEIDFLDSVQSTSTKDILTICTKQASLTEFSRTQTSKLIKTFDDTTRPITDQINLIKIKKISKSVKNSLVNDKEEHNNDTEIMPILIKEPNITNNIQNCDKPDIEIVEEKMKVIKNQQYNNCESTPTVIDMTEDKELPRTQYTVHKGPILDIKVFENSFLAASEDGRIYRYNQASNGILNIYKGHKAAVTCLYVYNANSIDINKEWMFSGSLDGTLRCYNIMTGIQIRDTADISSPIQCMDEAWGIIFIGTKSGHVSRYHIKSGVIKGNSIQFSDKSVLALKATNEGPRRVLIVASRNQPITIRDAQNGLFLRTICGQKNHTVYSLMRDYNLIYCGTSSTSIPVFDFTNGEQTMQYNAGVGIVCMRLYKQLLFAGCYDGNIYVFDTKDHRLICSIPGPGNMLLSMEVIDNKIIAGSKDKRLQSWQMPQQVLSLLLNQI